MRLAQASVVIPRQLRRPSSRRSPGGFVKGSRRRAITLVKDENTLDLAGDRCYRDQDQKVRELVSTGSAYVVRMMGVDGRRRVLGAVKKSLGDEHPTLVGQYVDSNDRMSYEDIHRAFGRAVLRLKEIGRPEVLVDDEDGWARW